MEDIRLSLESLKFVRADSLLMCACPLVTVIIYRETQEIQNIQAKGYEQMFAHLVHKESQNL